MGTSSQDFFGLCGDFHHTSGYFQGTFSIFGHTFGVLCRYLLDRFLSKVRIEQIEGVGFFGLVQTLWVLTQTFRVDVLTCLDLSRKIKYLFEVAGRWCDFWVYFWDTCSNLFIDFG
ncbi:MAG: hypothetical protein MUC49_20985 [Raineya sp.]|nr:hypothetical protein [Raineya sp.]